MTSVIARLNGMKICAPQAKRWADHRRLSSFLTVTVCWFDTIPVALLLNPFRGPSVADQVKLEEWSQARWLKLPQGLKY